MSIERAPTTIQHQRRPGLQATTIARSRLKEHHLTLVPEPASGLSTMVSQLGEFLSNHSAAVARHEVFGALRARDALLKHLQDLPGRGDWPVTWVDGGSNDEHGVAGMNVFAVSGAEVATVRLGGRPVGRLFDDGSAQHCLLGDLHPQDLSGSNPAQAWQIYESMEAALIEAGMSLRDVARTWLFLDDILSWYGPFNQVRTEIFTQRNLFEHGVPASTGVGAANAIGAAVVAGAWAVRPYEERTCIREVLSPLQCSASSYGSCFSRATEIVSSGHRRLLVSGTASIAPDGQSLHPGDVDRQVDLTMEVVEAILASRQMGWSDVSRAVAYFKHVRDGKAFTDWCGSRNLTMPCLLPKADICRDELLFEIELDAIGAACQSPTEKPPDLLP